MLCRRSRRREEERGIEMVNEELRTVIVVLAQSKTNAKGSHYGDSLVHKRVSAARAHTGSWHGACGVTGQRVL